MESTFCFATLLLGLAAALPCSFSSPAPPPSRYQEMARFPAPEARQGVAVDAEFAYVVTNAVIGKYRRGSWEKVAQWDGSEDARIVHFNDGYLHENRLYCAHSNYPDVPSLSSIELFDATTLKHIGSHSFGHLVGFANWVEHRDGRWYVCFAHYTGRAEHPGADSTWTQIIEFDSDWRRLRGWAFPAALVERFHGRSCSGGGFGPGGFLYVTGHDEAQLYVLEFPRMGSLMEWVGTIEMSPEGQAFAFDPNDPSVLWGIIKRTREVVVGRLLP
jgi:hypothetical protein